MWRITFILFIGLLSNTAGYAQNVSIKSVPVLDINPGIENSNPGGLTGDHFIVYNDVLFFSADDGAHGAELFAYDGRKVHLVADINPGVNARGIPEASKPSGFILFNDQLIFRADDGVHGRELFAYDGKDVRLVADINPRVNKFGEVEGSYPSHFIVFNELLIFKADNGMLRMELFVYDGAEVRLLADLFPGRKGSRARDFTLFNDTMLFSANNGIYDRQLFTYDGANIRYAHEIQPGSDLYTLPYLSNLQFAQFNNALFFKAQNNAHGAELFAYDGRQVQMTADINPVINDQGHPDGSNPTAFAVYNHALFFTANDGVHGRELFTYNGTDVRLAADISKGDGNPADHSSNPSDLIVFGDKLVFSADDGIHGDELFVYDGRDARLLKDIFPGFNRFGDPNSSDPRGFLVQDDQLFFTANEREDGGNIFVFDGAEVQSLPPPENTRITPGHVFSIFRLHAFNNTLVFSADDDVTGQELWQIIRE